MRPALGQAPNKYGSIAGKGTEALHFFYALEDSRIATAHYGVQSHAVGGEPESTLRGSVSHGKEEISSSHGADNTQPAKVISASETMKTRF
jgi:hypothetical protein